MMSKGMLAAKSYEQLEKILGRGQSRAGRHVIRILGG